MKSLMRAFITLWAFLLKMRNKGNPTATGRVGRAGEPIRPAYGECLQVRRVELFGQDSANGFMPDRLGDVQTSAQRAQQSHVEAFSVLQCFDIQAIGRDQPPARPQAGPV